MRFVLVLRSNRELALSAGPLHGPQCSQIYCPQIGMRVSPQRSDALLLLTLCIWVSTAMQSQGRGALH